MSNAVLPSYPGVKIEVDKAPMWSTRSSESASALERRVQERLYPKWKIDLSYEVLRDAVGLDEAEALIGFYNQRAGMFDSFLYADPDDFAANAYQFAIGDGATTIYQLLRAYGGFAEPVQNLNGAPQIFRNDWQGNQLMYTTPRTNLAIRSEEYDNAGAWSPTATGVALVPTVTANAGAAPDGTSTADRIQLSLSGGVTTGDIARIEQAYAGYTSGLPYVYSQYLKSNTGGNFTLAVANFNTQSGNLVVTPSWQRFDHPVTPGSTVASSFGIRLRGGQGMSATADILAWGGQLTQAAVGSAYIKTQAAPVTVTDYALDSIGRATFATAPLLNALLTWTGSYYWRVRFDDDRLAFHKMFKDLWELKKLPLIGSVMNKV